MSSRDTILAAVRAHKPKLDRPEPLVPMFDETQAELTSTFKDMLEKMGGSMLASDTEHPLAEVKLMIADANVICSNAPEIEGNFMLSVDTKPIELAEIDLGVVRAAFGVAETGSVCLTEVELGINTLGYLPQHLIVLLDPDDIVINIHHAYQQPQFHTANYAVFQTGPSATADIEGVLIHGAQGVRSLSVALVKRSENLKIADPFPRFS